MYGLLLPTFGEDLLPWLFTATSNKTKMLPRLEIFQF